MAPLPKRRFSTSRKGKRFSSQKQALKPVVICKHCGVKKQPHRACPKCHKK